MQKLDCKPVNNVMDPIHWKVCLGYIHHHKKKMNTRIEAPIRADWYTKYDDAKNAIQQVILWPKKTTKSPTIV